MRFGKEKRIILDPKVNGYEVRMYFTDKSKGETGYYTETVGTSDIWRLIEYIQDCEKLRKIEQSIKPFPGVTE